MTDEIRAFGLMNGMEYIGKVVSEDDYKFEMKSVLAIHVQPIDNGPNASMRLQLVPPTVFSNAEEHGRKGINIPLYKNSIVFEYPLREDILNQYILQTGSIIVAKGSLPK